MQQLPKIVRERLMAASRSNHPDPDVLTAFAERSLPRQERATVTEHLARCGECREVLALALPEVDEAVAAVAIGRPWLSMPVLRWGAIAAACMVLVSVGAVRYRLRSSEKTTAYLSNPKQEISESSKQSPAATSDTPAENALTVPALTAQKKMVARPNDANPQEGGSLGLPSMKAAPIPQMQGARVAHGAQQGLIAKNAPSFAPPSAPMLAVEVQSAAAPVSRAQSDQIQALADTHGNELSQNPGQQSDQVLEVDAPTVVGKAKAPLPQAAGSIASGISSPRPSPRWSISAAGGLRRSFDDGRSWQDVQATVQSAVTPLAPQAPPGYQPEYRQRSMQAKPQKDSPAVPVFRAISAAGSEIWAGAAGGVLYHSVDSGDHWMAAVPSDAGILLTGDIVSVQFDNSLQGQVATSTGEVWTTVDGGQHWSKR